MIKKVLLIGLLIWGINVQAQKTDSTKPKQKTSVKIGGMEILIDGDEEEAEELKQVIEELKQALEELGEDYEEEELRLMRIKFMSEMAN